MAKNAQTMLIARFFDGLSGSAFLSVAGGTVGDMFNRETLQLPMLIYTGSPFIGPSIGPLIGGFINQYANWRWTFYVLLIWSGANLGMIALFVPETYHPVLLRNKARKLRKETGDERWKASMEKTNKSIPKTIGYSLLRPFQLLFLEPMCFNLCLFSAILLGILYLFFGAFPLVFEGNHGFTLSQTGLAFLGIFVGMVLGSMTDPLWHRNYSRLIRQREVTTGEIGGSEPEYRLPPAIAGGFLVPAGLFLFAVSIFPSPFFLVFLGLWNKSLCTPGTHADTVPSRGCSNSKKRNMLTVPQVDNLRFSTLDSSYHRSYYFWHGVSQSFLSRNLHAPSMSIQAYLEKVHARAQVALDTNCTCVEDPPSILNDLEPVYNLAISSHTIFSPSKAAFPSCQSQPTAHDAYMYARAVVQSGVWWLMRCNAELFLSSVASSPSWSMHILSMLLLL